MASRTTTAIGGGATPSVARDAAALGAVRAGVHGVFLLVVLHDSFSSLGRLPVTILHPVGVMEYFSWKFYERLLTPQGMFAFKLALLVSLLMSTTGWWTSLTVKSSALLVTFYEGLLRSFGHYNHNEMVGVTILIMLAFTPCGDGFSLDALTTPPRQRPPSAYRYPVLLAQMIVAWIYFSGGLLKLRTSGMGYFQPDNLPAIFINWSLGNLNDTQFRTAFSIYPWRDLFRYVLMAVVAWEILFPVGVFWRRTRRWFLALGVLMHIAIMLTLNKVLHVQLAMFLVFIDWPGVGRRVRDWRPFRAIMNWWDDFRAAPEFFPGSIFAGAHEGGLLLWDGQCGFCKRMVGVVNAITLRPIAARPFQEVLSELPDEVRPWTSREMLWVRPSGEITGGSQAAIEVLEASYHNLISGALESRILRPFTWLAYRIVARNRGTAGDLVGANCAVKGPPD